MGARYIDAVFEDGSTHRCWAGFQYHVECEIMMTLENSTIKELMQLDISV